MFSKEFEIVLIAGLAIITVLLFLGRGDFMLKTKQEQKKKSPEEQKKFSRGISFFTGFWMVAELILFLFGDQKWVNISYLVAVLIALAGLIFYCKKKG